MMTTTRTTRDEHGIESRYELDCGMCSSSNGFAQIDSGQDASYYGIWANPYTLEVVSYAEGDLDITKLPTISAFASYIREMKTWNDSAGYGRNFGIDPGFNAKLKVAFVDAGLGDLLH
jgi:hypothetical protein